MRSRDTLQVVNASVIQGAGLTGNRHRIHILTLFLRFGSQTWETGQTIYRYQVRYIREILVGHGSVNKTKIIVGSIKRFFFCLKVFSKHGYATYNYYWYLVVRDMLRQA